MAETQDPNTMYDSGRGKEGVDTSNTNQTLSLPDKEVCDVLRNTLQDKISEFEKAIEIGEQLPKDNPENQNGLASAYNDLANLQQDHLGEYELSKSNYEKAIAIREQLPKDDPEYQNNLACAYHNLAKLQQNHLGDYDSAKENYEKAIEIREQLPKGNPKYQNFLAGSYNSLAYCYKAQKQYTEAITAVNNAIAITKQLSDNNAKYLPDWINYNHSLAEIYFDNNEITKAKDILVQIQPIAQKCLDEKPNDSWTQGLNDAIADLLSKLTIEQCRTTHRRDARPCVSTNCDGRFVCRIKKCKKFFVDIVFCYFCRKLNKQHTF